jgi:cold shock CspA family protein
MQIPLQIAFKNVPHSNALESAIRLRAAKLDRYAGGELISCRITVQEPNKRHQQGNIFVVTIDVKAPGFGLVVGHPSGEDYDHLHENPYFALNDSFTIMERKIKEHRAMRRREVKRHSPRQLAHVSRYFPQDGYGFITTPDGREIYFHVNSVLNGAAESTLLDIGTEVRYIEELGDQGPQATTVECLRKATPALPLEQQTRTASK